MKHRYHYQNSAENADKVWDIDELPYHAVDAFKVEVRWGKTCARKLRSVVKSFPTFGKARGFIRDKCAEKIRKGYRQLSPLDIPSAAGRTVATSNKPPDPNEVRVDARATSTESLGRLLARHGEVTLVTGAKPTTEKLGNIDVPESPVVEKKDSEGIARLRDSLKRGRELFL